MINRGVSSTIRKILGKLSPFQQGGEKEPAVVRVPPGGSQNNFIQLKLASGEEIIADLPHGMQSINNKEIMINNAMQMVCYDIPGSDRMFEFAPFMIYQELESNHIALNSKHVVSMGLPVPALLLQYRMAIRAMHGIGRERWREMLFGAPSAAGEGDSDSGERTLH